MIFSFVRRKAKGVLNKIAKDPKVSGKVRLEAIKLGLLLSSQTVTEERLTEILSHDLLNTVAGWKGTA